MRPPPPVCVVRVCLRLCLAVLFSSAGDVHSVLQHIQSYEISSPVWLHPSRHIRAANKEHPPELQVLISAEGQQLTVHLEKNEQLLAPGYQEIWYTPDGVRRSSSPGSTANCFYHGEVLGIEGSSAAVSTCTGLRGLISLNASVSYLIEPLPDPTQAQQHAVFRAESLHLPKGSCPHHPGNKEHQGGLNDFLQGMASPQSGREKREAMQNMKYVELLLVADRAEFQRNGLSFDKTQQKLLEAANLVDKFYKPLNIRVALIGLEVWTDQDKIGVSDNPHSTLAAFLSWRRKMLKAFPNDNAQLVTGVSFQGSTIGLAPLKTMCSEYQSGGVNTDHSPQPVGVAATIAHEMGHNFGMNHDREGCCQAKDEDGGCIMAAATGSPFPRVFNPCNQKELKSYLNSGGGKCLFNMPNINQLYGGQRCGNGYLEKGEECDCGEEEECTSPCCNANNCTLKPGAECAHGVCCHDCKIRSPGELCRATSGLCDLPEYCDGKSESCPDNFYLADGTSCAHGRAYCYTGMCLTLEQQCQFLWGRDARPAPDLCFKEVNKAGDMYGNCGKDQQGKYRICRERDAKCGKIQCSASASKPIENNAVRIETTVKVDSKRTVCLGTHVYNLNQGDEEPLGDTLDPGLVMTGTKCGDNSICFNGECRNASFLRADECIAKCHGHGLCNNNHNCHCNPGWAPPWCDQSGPGGSLDSGPPKYTGIPIPVLLLLVIFGILATVGVWFCYKRRLGLLKSFPAPPVRKRPDTTEGKPMETETHVIGHANPTFLVTKQELSTPQPIPSCPAKPRHAIIRPTVKPPPIPPYAAKENEKEIRQKPTAPSPPVACNHQQTSPQGHKQPLLKANRDTEGRPNQVSQKSPGPPSLPSQDPKRQVRPDPPKRPPPPCPVNKQCAGQHNGNLRKLESLNKLIMRKNEALAPSAGQKMPNRV